MLKLTPEILDGIKETWYVTGTVPKFDIAILEFSSASYLNWMSLNYTEIVYVENDGKIEVIFTFHMYSDTHPKKSYQFKKYLKKLKNLNINTLNFLCTFYLMGENPEFFKSLKGKNNIINLITKDTCYEIVFDYQAAYLYGLFSGKNGKEVWDWVNKMNQGTPEAIVAAKSIEFGTNNNLFNILNDYGIGIFHEPNYKGALALFNHIQRFNKQVLET